MNSPVLNYPFVFSNERGRENMDICDEKCRIYEQLKLLMEERRKISKQYYELKEYLIYLENGKTCENILETVPQVLEKKRVDLQSEKELQDYFTQRKVTDNYHRSYRDYGFIIASILKESGKPLSNRQLYEALTEKTDVFPDYRNFVNNILPKINQDESIHVERVMRGYWQYRFAT